MNWEAFFLSMHLALVTSVALLLIGLPLSYWIARSRWRWLFFVEALVSLPIILPPTVLGFYLLVGMGPQSALGHAIESLFGGPIVFTFSGLVIASMLYSLPFTVQPLSAAFSGVDKRLVDLSRILGKSPLETFLGVFLPLSFRGILTAFIMSFAHTLGEFGIVLMVGGNIPGVTRTLSIDLYDQVQAMNYQGASETALFLLLVSFLFLSLVYYIDRGKGMVMMRVSKTQL